jgi:hypothetical protein
MLTLILFVITEEVLKASARILKEERMEGEEEEVPTAGTVFVVGRKKIVEFFLRKRKKRKRKRKLPY